MSNPLPKSTTGSKTYNGPGNDAIISGSKKINLSKNGWFCSNASIFYCIYGVGAIGLIL